ncbi:MAG: FecR family protein [Polaribacter sp.]|nr:FecR family protein [Polaribacter sp.]
MIKKNYNTIEDFLNDTSFINWAKENKLSDASFWEDWIANNPEKKAMVYDAKEIVVGIQFKKTAPSKEKISLEWEKLEKKINKKSRPIFKRQKPGYSRYIAIAASIALFISLGAYLMNNNFSKTTHKTTYGEFLNLTLKDGSKVTLNSNSSISYYKNNPRKVWLTGEAFFEVDKKETTQAKFWVLTGDLSVEVYGTSFNVDTKHQKTDVFLEEGAIFLAFKNGQKAKMKPGNFISYSSKKNLILEQRSLVNTSHKTSWKNGTIVFENSTLSNAIKRIEDTYGLTAVFKDKKAATRSLLESYQLPI